MKLLKAGLAIVFAHSMRLLGGLIVLKMIAIYLGPTGLGKLGHFMSLISILSVMAGGGILNGVVKYVSEYQNDSLKLKLFLTNATNYSLAFSFLIFVFLTILSQEISLFFFQSADYKKLIIAIGVIQFCYAFVNLYNGTINGVMETRKYAIVLATGTVFSLLVSFFVICNFGFSGAVVALASINASLLLPAWLICKNLKLLAAPSWKINKTDTSLLAKFTMMQVFSIASLPLAEIYIRKLIFESSGWHDAGLWQSVMRLSNVYLGLFSTFLSAYYLPMLAKISKNHEARRYVLRYVIGVGSVFSVMAVVTYLLSDPIFTLIYSKEFLIPKQFMYYQLIGDLFKIMSYVIGFLILSRVNTKTYILAEVVQASLYLCFSIATFQNGMMLGLFRAYALSNALYFLFALLVLHFIHRSNTKEARTV